MKLMSACLYALLMFLAVSAASANGAEILNVTAERDEYPLERHLEIFEDKKGRLSFEEVSSSAYKKKFTDSQKGIPNFSFTRSAYWVRFHVAFSDRAVYNSDSWILKYRWPFVASISAYIKQRDGQFKKIETGCAWPGTSRDIPARLFMFKVNPLKGELVTVYLRCSSRGILTFPLELISENMMIRDIDRDSLLYGIFFGIMIVMIFYHLLMYTAVKDADYIFFSLFIAAQCMIHLLSDGFITWYLNLPVDVIQQCMISAASISVIFIILFSGRMLNLRRDMPHLNTVCNISAGVYAVFVIFSFLSPEYFAWKVFFFISLAVNSFLFVLSIIRMIQGYGLAVYFFVFMLLYITASALFTMMRFNLLPFNNFTGNMRSSALVLEAFILAYAISKRIRSMDLEKTAAQNEAIRSLERADRVKDEFLSGASRELRAPLYGIVGLAEVMLKNSARNVPEYVKENFLLIASSGRRLLTLINDMLDFSNIRYGGMMLAVKPVDLRGAVSGVFSLLSPLTEGKAIELRNSISPLLPPVSADEVRLKQILSSLGGNAIRFTPYGVVEASARTAGAGMMEITLSYTGTGGDLDDAEGMFDPFEQTDSLNKRIYGGTGIGLSVAKNLVELQGGSIRAESGGESGVSFIFTLPLSDTSHAESLISHGGGGLTHETLYAESDSAADVAAGHGGSASPGVPTLLIVDDDPVSMKILLDCAAQKNYHSIAAANGTEALDILNGNRHVDMVILDIMMTGISGYDILRKIRKKRSADDLPVIFVTVKSLIDDINAGFSAGANDYIIKPFEMGEFSRRIDNILKSTGRIEKEAPGLRVRERDSELFFPYRDILYVSSCGKKTALNTTGGVIEITMLLKNLEERLPENFVRIHRQHIINMEHLIRINHHESWNYEAALINNSVLPVGRTYIAAVRDYIKHNK